VLPVLVFCFTDVSCHAVYLAFDGYVEEPTKAFIGQRLRAGFKAVTGHSFRGYKAINVGPTKRRALKSQLIRLFGVERDLLSL
jgi:hypothetical protein